MDIKEFEKKLEEMSAKHGISSSNKNNKKTEDEQPNSAFEGYFLGLGLISHVIIGLAIGYWVDKFFDCSPFGLLFFLFLGFIAGFRNIWQNIK